MSAAAIARKRRAESSAVSQNSIPSASNPSVGPNTNASPNNSVNNTSRNPTTGLTLPQVISVIDTRLIVLENFMKETKQSSENITMNSNPVSSLNTSNDSLNQGQDQDQAFQNHVIEEFETRFDILAGEIADLKDIVLKLQTYTMDVNKTLLEERIHILSDIEDTSKKVEPNTYGFECNQDN
jgi:hypothetical protein